MPATATPADSRWRAAQSSCSRRPARRPWTVRAAYHEAFHVVDDWLTLEERRLLDAAVDRGAPWPTPYLSSRVERRARLFEHVAMFVHEGGSIIAGRRVPETEILAAVYDGTIGQRVLAQQTTTTTRWPRWLYGLRSGSGASSTTTTISPGSSSLM